MPCHSNVNRKYIQVPQLVGQHVRRSLDQRTIGGQLPLSTPSSFEGSEFDLFENFFEELKGNGTVMPFICQILFELHLPGGTSEEPTRRLHRLFESFRALNCAIFHKEVNLYVPQTVCEFALLRLNRAFFIPPV